MNLKSPNNTSKWQMGFNLAFKGLIVYIEKNMSCGGRGCPSVYGSVSWPSFICNFTFYTFGPAVPTFSHVEPE
jgi:hypothetical protein